MKIISRIFVILLSLAVCAFLGVAILAPEKGLELQEKLENIVTRRSEAREVSPVRTLEVSYEFNVQEILDKGCDASYRDSVYTWFRDLGRDLWLPFVQTDFNDEQFIYSAGGAALCDQTGVVKRFDPGIYRADINTGECVLPAEALADVPEGDYWLALQVIPDEIIEEVSGPFYTLRYISIHDHCDFHTEDYQTANCFDVLYDRSGGEPLTYHLLNLGDNTVTDVWKLEYSLDINGDISFTQKRLKEGRDYTISGDGAAVTISAEYLASLQNLYGYNFEFGLADHSSLNTAYSGEDGSVLYLTDGPLPDRPRIDGPMTYSLSSGEDYVFTIHQGQAQQIWATELFFHNQEGQRAADDDGSEKNWMINYKIYAREDGSCAIPASLFQEAAAAGYGDSAWIYFIFQVTDFGYSGFYPGSGYNIRILP